ncbi:MAG: hypothetical protein HQL38_01560 [Alphaproteobacteria bacterium]|nr:hypothetical protein [Alphaproteobacteria bacterium]
MEHILGRSPLVEMANLSPTALRRCAAGWRKAVRAYADRRWFWGAVLVPALRAVALDHLAASKEQGMTASEALRALLDSQWIEAAADLTGDLAHKAEIIALANEAEHALRT